MPSSTTERKVVDRCGPAGDGWFARWLSKKIPDVLEIRGHKINIGPCCADHDDDNTANGANKAGDEKLKECVRCKLRAALLKKREIWFYSNLYYWGPRIGNPFYKDPPELWRDFKKEMVRRKNKILGRD